MKSTLPMTVPLESPLLTVQELSAMLRISVSSVWRLRERGKLPPGIRLGHSVRWRRKDVEEFIRKL